MQPDYKNWCPSYLVVTAWCLTLACLVLCLILAWRGAGVWAGLAAVALLGSLLFAIFATLWYRAFSYTGSRKLSLQIVEGVASYLEVPAGGRCLDVGCGSGALTIACAKRHPGATFVGVDRWGKEYAYDQQLCRHNATAEGVDNVSFVRGDALKLNFEDESFDAVTSNYVYHNLHGRDLQAVLLETLRVLKKGGTFVIHDLFNAPGYGHMERFMETLRAQGYAKVELIDTTPLFFRSRTEAKWLMLGGSKLLIGKK